MVYHNRVCKACKRENVRATQHRAIKQRLYLKRLYGITPERYDALLEGQGGGCAICGGSCTAGRRLAVDHNHATGEVRGLLCSLCNTGLGSYRDSPELLSEAINYLRRTSP